MLGIMGCSASFVNTAKAKAKKGEYLTFVPQNALSMFSFANQEDCIITHIVGGEPVQTNVEAGTHMMYNISADANSIVRIDGKITMLKFAGAGPQIPITQIDLSHAKSITEIAVAGNNLTSLDLSANTAITNLECYGCTGLTSLDLSANTAITVLDLSGCTGLTSLDLSANTAITNLGCDGCTGLTSLDLSANTAITVLNFSSCTGLTSLDLSANTAITQLTCNNCHSLTELDLSKNTAITQLNCNNCHSLTELDLSKNTAITQLNCGSCEELVSISYPATNSDVSTTVAYVITAATSTTGTVYTDSAAAYYSTIADAATTKGWTIAQIPA